MDPFFIYKPQSLAEIRGQEKAVKTIQDYFTNFKKGQGLFLYGPPGSGKTASIYAYAKKNNIELLELNASDGRNAKELESFLSKATGQMSLFATKKIILLDEVDGLSGMKDRGAPTTIVKFIKKSIFPIIMTGTNVFDKKFSALKKISQLVPFETLSTNAIVEILQDACTRSKTSCKEEELRAIARHAAGDGRGALNDLFTYLIIKNSSVEDIGIRKQTEELASALIKVFKSRDPDVVFGSFDNVKEDLDKIFLWVDENLPREYTKAKDLNSAFDVLAQADRFFGRIRRWQYYRFYVYSYLLLSVGISLSKDEKYRIAPNYKQPTRLLRYWQANMAFSKRKSILQKLAQAQRISYKNALKNYAYILPALASDKDLQEEIELTPDEIMWLQKQSGAKA